ncbi:uncharacterized protein LOC117475186 [Trematomus bernacchii]|uniref:uncharacterized protein LOC117475186 n=1 Tax=Trematomus bernacchii TaxID=40690 RepID=UPI00146C6D57|nr:uncharacterized protein LOC117475186 [Trematomus bernacchii]
MSEFRRIIMSSFLMLLLHFTAAKLKYSSFTVRPGDEVTLPCDNVIHDQDKCESTSWHFIDSSSSTAVELVHRGQIGKEDKAKSDRLRVTEKCSLFIKKVTEEDAGQYNCRQLSSGQQEGPVTVFDLSVVTMTEHHDNDEVTLNCSVKTHGQCKHPVKWLLQGRDVVKDHRKIKTSQSFCSASVTFLTFHFSNTPRFELFTCVVRDEYTGEEHQFPFSPQSSGWWWWIIVVIVGVAALTIITVAVIRRKRTQGNETQTDDNVADPEDGASYTSVSYTSTTSSKARAHDDEDDALTYSTVTYRPHGSVALKLAGGRVWCATNNQSQNTSPSVLRREIKKQQVRDSDSREPETEREARCLNSEGS